MPYPIDYPQEYEMQKRRSSRHLPAPKGSRRAGHKVKVVVGGDHDKVEVAINDHRLEWIIAIGCMGAMIMIGAALLGGTVLVSMGVLKLSLHTAAAAFLA
jgi:hypothetical protein